MLMRFRFAHIADCHVGAWVDPRMKELPLINFERAIDISIERNVDFVLISGDLFNTALPGIDPVTRVVKGLKELNNKGIRVYAIAGSHDFSPSGKTMLNLLEETGLIIIPTKNEIENDKLVLHYIKDKSGAKITGIVGRRNTLDKAYYEMLLRERLESEEGFKIFMFHNAIAELKEKGFEQMEALPLSMLPRKQDYYAGGHVHSPLCKDIEDFGRIVFTGPLFPANFKELEKLKTGSFYINDVEGKEIKSEKIEIMPKNIFSIKLDCSGKTPQEVYEAIIREINDKEFNETIVMIRLSGELRSGKINDIDFRAIFEKAYNKSAYFVMKNTYNLESKKTEVITKQNDMSVEELETQIINESVKEDAKISKERQIEIAKVMLQLFAKEKHEGETQKDFEKRIIEEAKQILNLDE